VTNQETKTGHQAESVVHPLWSVHRGQEPLFATALHAGHELRDDLSRLMALDESARLREEDPYTDYLATVVPNRLVPSRSRFEVDLNRARGEAVYLAPPDAWGLKVWSEAPTEEEIEQSLEEYDEWLTDLELRYGRFVIFDIHSYNYRRGGPDAPPEDPTTHPEVNVGTGTMERERWAPVVDRFIHDLRAFDFLGRHLDVREKVKFKGRQFAHWVHTNFPETGCVLALEFKKFFMDEWTGRVDPDQLEAIYEALRSTLPGIAEEMAKL
jgi:N-formylglutamate deformylase